MKTAADVTEAEIAVYRATAQRRWARRRQAQARQCERAWSMARQAATVLRERFGIRRAVLIGSLARGDLFHVHSDVDLAVWGLDDREYYRAVSCVLDIDPAIAVDLVLAEEAPPSLRAVIEHVRMQSRAVPVRSQGPTRSVFSRRAEMR